MSNTFNYTHFKLSLGLAAFNLNNSDTLKIGLLTSAYSPNQDTDTVWSDISTNEVVGTGYTPGGQTLTSVTWATVLANSWGASRAASTAYTVGQLVKPAVNNGFVYKCTVAGTTGADVVPTAGTNASPIVVTAAAHGLTTGDTITIAAVTGNTNMNGTWLVVVLSSSTYNLMNPATLALVNGNGTFGGSPTIVPGYPLIYGESINDGGVQWQCFAESVVVLAAANPSWASSTITARYAAVYDVTAGNKLICLKEFTIAGSPANYTSTNGTFSVTFDANAGVTYLG